MKGPVVADNKPRKVSLHKGQEYYFCVCGRSASQPFCDGSHAGSGFDPKARKVAQFLGEGHKVKVTIMFRGREMQHPELGRKILDRVAEDVSHLGKVEVIPKQDGRNMIMVLGPDKKAQAEHRKAQEAEQDGGEPAAED